MDAMTEVTPTKSAASQSDTVRLRGTAKDPAMNCRMPQALFDYIDEAALRNGRSRNSEVLERLWRTVLQEDGSLPEKGQ